MKRALTTKLTKQNKADQPGPRRSSSVDRPTSEASLKVASAKSASLTEEENWKQDMAILRKAAAERARLRTESLTPKREAPTPHIVKSLANPYVAVRKMAVPAPRELDPKLKEDEGWKRDMATLRKAAAERALLRTESPKLERKKLPAPIQEVVKSLADPQAAVCTTSVQALYDLDPDRAASLLN